MAGSATNRGTPIALLLALLTTPMEGRAQSVVEGKVELPHPPAATPARVRYAGQPVRPGPPEAPTAIVYLEGAPLPPLTNAPEPVLVLQTNLQFASGLIPVRLGAEVLFPNRDEVYHNVFSYSKPKRFDLGRYRKDETPPPLRFDRPGLVKLYCEIHSHMRARILVLETPYFTKTDTNGVFRLENLPAGKFQIKAWIDEDDIRMEAIQLQAGQTTTINFAGHP